MLSRLMADHDNIQKTLNILEVQFMELCRNRKPDLSVMLSIVVYIQDYPEQAHHPLEDAILSLLIKKGTDEIRLARELLKDHTELESLTRKLRRTLETVKSSDNVPDDLKRQISEFLLRQRRHFYIEEMKLYPLIDRTLTKQDWDEIQAMVPVMDDPVFGEYTRNDYENLYRLIDRKQ